MTSVRALMAIRVKPGPCCCTRVSGKGRLRQLLLVPAFGVASINHRRLRAKIAVSSAWTSYGPYNSNEVGLHGSNDCNQPTSSSSSSSSYSINNTNESTPSSPSQGWGQYEYNTGAASTWEDSSSPWPGIADWGETYQPGDWGDPDHVSPGQRSYSPTQQQQLQQQEQYQQNVNGTAASYNAGTAAGYSAASPTGAGSSSATDAFGSSGTGAAAYSYSPPTSDGNSSSYGYEQQGSWPFADASAQQQQQSFRGAAGTVPPPAMPSDITLIGRRDADSMLPLTPSTEQARYYQPRTLSERLVQVIGSFGVSVVLSKSAVLAGPALLYPVWGPWIRAGLRNVQLYLRQFKCVGLWRAEVLSVKVNTIPYAYRQAGGDTATVTVGDPWPGGARTELTFAYQEGCEDIVEGEPAELLVLCQDDSFDSFKVVREVYLPQSGMWLSEYPFVDRDVFLDVSLAIERGRQAAAAPNTAAAAGAGYADFGVGAAAAGPGYGNSSFSTAAAADPNSYAGYSASAYTDSMRIPATGFAAPAAAAAAAGGYAAGGMYSSCAAGSIPGAYDVVTDSAAGAGTGAATDYGIPVSSNGSDSTGSDGSAYTRLAGGVPYVDARAAAAQRAGIYSNVNEVNGLGSNVSSSGSEGHASNAAYPSSSSSSVGIDCSGNIGSTAEYANGDSSSSATDHSGSSNASSHGSTGFLSLSDFSIPDLQLPAVGIVDDLSGVASQVSDVASQVTGVATHVASDVASGVAAGVAAGLGWLSEAAGSNGSSSGSSSGSGSDTAVVPDVIIDNQGVWSPAAGGYSSMYGTPYGYSSSSSWTGSGQYGQPYVDQGFTGVYQRDAAGYGSGRYAGSSFYSQPYGTGYTAPGFGPAAAAGMDGSFGGSAAGSYSGYPNPAAAAPEYGASGGSNTANCAPGQQQNVHSSSSSDGSNGATSGRSWVPGAQQPSSSAGWQAAPAPSSSAPGSADPTGNSSVH